MNNQQTAKQQLLKNLQDNEHVVQVLSAEQIQQEFEAKGIDVTELSKLLAGHIAPGKDALIARTLVKEFGFTGKVVLKEYAGKTYIILKGLPGNREIFTGTRYLATNPKVIRMAVGPKGISDSVKGGFVLTIILSVGIEVVDFILNDTRTLQDLLGTITGDIIKIGISAICSALAAAAIGGAIGVAASAATPLIMAIGVGVFVGWALGKVDENIGATAALIEMYEKMGINLNQTIEEIQSIPYKINYEIYRLERSIIQRALNQAGIY